MRHPPILDLDGTILTVYGHQQFVEVGYNPRKHGRPSYHAILCFARKDGSDPRGSSSSGA